MTTAFVVAGGASPDAVEPATPTARGESGVAPDPVVATAANRRLR